MDTDLGRRVATALIQARGARGWTQRDLARVAGVSQSAVARAERDAGVSVDVLERLLRATEASVTVRTPVAEADGRGDLIHRIGLRVLRRLYVRSQMSVATEQAVTDGSIRGWIDLLAYGPERARLEIVEFKSEISDLGATERQIERYARNALEPARALGWRVREIVVVLVVLATETADAFVAANRAELAAAFPVRGRAAVRMMLDGAPITGRAILALDPWRPGRTALASFRVDGRRRPFRFVRTADARRFADERSQILVRGRAQRPRGKAAG
jgi:transcriptional regulator with XRE-family HTH domain